MIDLLEQLAVDMTEATEQAQRSLVQIGNGRSGFGAGTIWHPSGLIITNAHVVRKEEPEVRLRDGQKLRARVLAYDKEHDLAALSVPASDLPAAELGDSKNLRPGQWVFAVGHPWGVAGAVTGGIVIGTGREWSERPLNGGEWVVVNLHLRPGHSGGPLVDAQGRLIGINTMMTGPDVGVAVPVHIAKQFLKEALAAQVA